MFALAGLLLAACASPDAPEVDAAASAVSTCPASAPHYAEPAPDVTTDPGLSEDDKCALAERMAREGDLVFTEIAGNPIGEFVYGHVADLTSSWSSHVGIVVVEDGELLVAQSTLSTFDSTSRKTPLCEFLGHSREGRFTLRRLPRTLGSSEIAALHEAIDARMGIPYDLGFDLDRPDRSYCSRFVWEIYREALGIDVGYPQTLREIVDARKAADPSFDDTIIRLWFLSPAVPWCRRMVTPASQLVDPGLETVVATD